MNPLRRVGNDDYPYYYDVGDEGGSIAHGETIGGIRAAAQGMARFSGCIHLPPQRTTPFRRGELNTERRSDAATARLNHRSRVASRALWTRVRKDGANAPNLAPSR